MLVLFTDTDTDITPAEAKEFGYHLISMPYSIDGVTTYPYEDFDEFDAHAFYDQLRGGVLPNTSAISTQKYKEYFEPHFKEGNDILYVHFSRNMTATFDNMDIAVKELLEQMGGSIELQSEQGKGTTFYISLPCEMIYMEKKSEIIA